MYCSILVLIKPLKNDGCLRWFCVSADETDYIEHCTIVMKRFLCCLFDFAWDRSEFIDFCKYNIYVLNINMEIIAWTWSNWLKYRNFNYKTIFGLFLFRTIFFDQFFRSILSPPVYLCNLSFNIKITSNFNKKTQNLLDKRYKLFEHAAALQLSSFPIITIWK